MKKTPWASPMTERAAPGTLWCISCARVSLSRAATCLVDGDPLCELCGPRVAAEIGDEAVALRPAEAPTATPVPVSPATAPALPPSPAPQPEPKELPTMPRNRRLTAKEVAAIRAADPSIPNTELAEKYGVSSGTIWYQRSKGAPLPAKSAAAPTVAKQLPPAVRNAATAARAAVTAIVSFELTHTRADQMWMKFTLDQKASAIGAVLTAELEQ